MNDAATMRSHALALAQRGDDAGAARVFAEAVNIHSRDVALLNSAGNFHATANRPADALTLFDRALRLKPDYGEASINRAVVLVRLDRSAEAAAFLRAGERRLSDLPRYWTTRASAEIGIGALKAAAASYDMALRQQPGNSRARHGRARVSLDRGEQDAVARYDHALALTPGDPELLLGLANALDAAGDREEALRIGAALAGQLPGWVDGLELYATLRWAAGERAGFCDHYAAAVRAAPQVPTYRSWAAMLAGIDRHTEAARIISAARGIWPADDDLPLLEAIFLGEAGESAAAAAIFDRQASTSPDWQIAEARHRLRVQDPEAAERLLAAALATRPDDVTAWSLRDLAWRIAGDSRHEWLHRQPGLIQQVSLDLAPDQMERAIAMLDRLHDHAAMPIGQSVKDGSQTRGALFARPEPEIAMIAEAVERAIATYRRGLPAADAAHPLLRHRDRPWRVTGSWSIRLAGRGRHAAHIHPAGVISSAAYFLVPPAVDDPERSGWLELGRPPLGLSEQLPPVERIRPREGFCALFPSTLYHGTRPIHAGKRMTVAFDVGTISAAHS